MDKYFEVKQKSLDLSLTIEEGLWHIKGLFSEGRYEDALSLLQDVLMACTSIQEAIKPFINNLSPDELQLMGGLLQNSLEQMAAAYEKKDWSLAQDIMQLELLPDYTKWKGELERCLGRFLAS